MTYVIIGGIAAFVLLLVALCGAGYVKAPSDKAFIITGFRAKRILIGKSGIKIPFLERKDELDLSLIPVDVRTSSEVPTADYINVRTNANVNIRIGQTDEMLDRASTHFLNLSGEAIGRIARETLEASVREIIGTMPLEAMVSNREMFTSKVLETAVPDLAKMGLEIISFNVQDFTDANSVIENLGVDNVEQIRKKAQISKSQAQKEIAVAEARAKQEANEARVSSAEAIAERNAQLELKEAELKGKVDRQKAAADAAESIEAEHQRKLRDIASTDADIARAERQAELRQKEVELKEYELDALVRKQADAEKYAAEQKADADLARRKREAEGRAYEIEQQAKAQKAKADADRYAAQQQAESIAAIGAAEAEAIRKKAEAQKQMGEASVLEMYFKMLPQAIANAAAPLEKTEKIVMYGEGNSAKVVKDVMLTADQIIQSIEESTGMDVKSIIAGYLGGKASQ